ncbi:deoxyribonuclease-2-alpha [Bufo gargarizans]|uniref:deoxyribonuclease-2-alpha n=1 Tax=Bufo gargarizans TaxID=30331 RepID=UPI001CF32F2B|nr:deoxyribonuclease-2-alpha [Bufo gargarizans]XP_044134887.1 deoxyribonuclease-2-alpha [Bufo gargarizans]XP_044134889.1 deoxyribonuclease-2-alpha [Bufo gargarizans]
MPLQILMSLILPGLCSAAISCYGDHGQPVDWFIVYKLPHLDHTPEDGLKYMYQDSDSGGWVHGAALINSTESAVGSTLSQLYQSSKSKNVAYVLYNDQPPVNGSNAIRGHTKGVVLLDKKQGFWLVHSTPHFPPLSSQKYDWPSNAFKNGQSFICVTYPYAQFIEIGTQLLYNTITPYDSSIPSTFSDDLPDLMSAAMKKKVTKSPWNRQVTLTSAGGKQFTSFAKDGRFGDDLYSGWVSEVLKSDLYVQFWLNSRGILLSNCSLTYHTYDVVTISFGSSISYSSNKDHSKWCVTSSDSPGWACVGDMNRDLEEMQRGGGTLCSSDPRIWKSFKTLVSKYSTC